MLKKIHYLSLLGALIALAGCETVHGAATGFGQDIHNVSEPSQNGWDALKKTDAWMQQNLW